MYLRTFLLALTPLVLAACTTGAQEPEPTQASGIVVTANPHATAAGLAVLEQGGSAVDAAVAIEAVLSLVEPQSSGLGGGAFLVHYDADEAALLAYDGRETAPASTTADRFLDPAGKPLGYFDAKHSGLSTGVPGAVAMLALAHSDHGSLPWEELFERAISLAEAGFAVSPRLHNWLARFRPYMPDTPDEGPLDAFRYLYTANGEALPVGHRLTNPAYASALRSIARDPRNFYRGEIAAAIVEQVGLAPRGGAMTLQDLADYRAVRRQVLCLPYRDLSLCGPPPASSWLAVGQIMGLLERGPAFSEGGAGEVRNWALFANAQKLAYADRDQYVADAEQAQVPVAGLLHPQYLEQRAALLRSDRALKDVQAGDPWPFAERKVARYGRDNSYDEHGTTHFVVVDADGDVVSMTASVESIFGSTRMVGGMFLNNQLTDFSRVPTDAAGRLVANAPAPGKRPRSSMSPTIVLDKEGEFFLATGSPGGNNIIAYVAKTLVGVLDWGLSPQQAIELPNMVVRGDVTRLEKGLAGEDLIEGLRELGFAVDASRGENSGLSMALRRPDGSLEGGVDPRREGVIAQFSRP